MADYEIRRRASIGIPSLILIFIVLCLATFGILTLENARREDSFSRKNAAAVQEYYRADGLGEEFLQQVDRALIQGSRDAEERKEQVLKAVGLTESPDSGLICADISMEAGQALHIELAVDWEQGRYRIQTWKVYDRANYEIDQSVPVWTGGAS